MKNIILKEDRQTRGKENDTSHKLECLKPFTNFMFIYDWNLDFKALQRKKNRQGHSCLCYHWKFQARYM